MRWVELRSVGLRRVVRRLRVRREVLLECVNIGIRMYQCRETYMLGNHGSLALTIASVWCVARSLALLLGLLLSLTLGSVLSEACLQLFRSFHLALLCVGLSILLAGRRIASQSPALGILLVVLVQNALSVRINELIRDAHHAEYLWFNSLSAFNCVVDGFKRRLVHLLQVDRQSASSVKATVAIVTLEVLCLLVRDENLLVIKVALTVIAPRARDELLDVNAIALFLDHGCGDVCVKAERVLVNED